MTIKLTHGSLFTGVGGFDMGAELAGIETKWQCEIDKNPTKVLERKWPKVTRYTDVCKVKGNEIDPVDIISFGSPCQDLSVAGKRAGLTGSRSSLYHEAIRITKEMRDATNNQYPRFIIWENVRGALSSNAGRDFYTAVQEMAKLGAMDISYRLVNACRFGVPQRRVRVFLIADLDGLCAGKILTESEGLLWHPTQNKSKGQEVTSETGESIEGTSQETTGKIIGTLVSRMAKGLSNANTLYNSNELIINTNVFVKSSRAQSATGYETWKDGEVSPTLNLMDNTGDSRATVLKVEPIVFMPHMTDGARIQDKTMGTLVSTMGTGGNNVPMVSKQKTKTTYSVRRLTPVECERLMGWPDNHTELDKDGNVISDSARYKMIGNGIVTPVAQWVCTNIIKALEEEKHEATN